MDDIELEALRARLDELREEHRKLDETIVRIDGGTPLDQLRIQRMKKRKLSLKDEIARIENMLMPDIIA